MSIWCCVALDVEIKRVACEGHGIGFVLAIPARGRVAFTAEEMVHPEMYDCTH